MSEAKLAEIIEIAKHELKSCVGDPGTILSPDGWCERYACADVLRTILKAAGEEIPSELRDE